MQVQFRLRGGDGNAQGPFRNLTPPLHKRPSNMDPPRGARTPTRSPIAAPPPAAPPLSRSFVIATQEATPQQRGAVGAGVAASVSATTSSSSERRIDPHPDVRIRGNARDSQQAGRAKPRDRSPCERSKSPPRTARRSQQSDSQTQHQGSLSYDKALYARDGRHTGGRRDSLERAIQSRGQTDPTVPQGHGSNGGPQRPAFESGAKGQVKTHRGKRAGKSREARKAAQSQAKHGKSSSSKASSNSWGTSVPSQQHHSGPSHSRATFAIHGRAGPSHSSSHSPAPSQLPTLQYVSPPPDLMSALLDGPSRKRKRDESGGSAGEWPAKRHHWENNFDEDTRSWLDQLRHLATDALADSGKVQLEKEALAREVDFLREALAEERWNVRVLRGLEVEESGARWKYIEEEVRRLRHPPPRDDSKRYDMYGETDLSDASDSDDMFVRSDPGDGDDNDSHRAYNERAKEHQGRTHTQLPHSRAVSPPRWLASPPHVPPPPAPRSSQHHAYGRHDGNGQSSRAPTAAVPRRDQRIEHAASMDEVEVEGAAIYASSGIDGPDLNDIDVEHALAAAEEDQRAAEVHAAAGLVERSLDAILASLPAADPNAALREAVWNFTQGHRTPMPLGRFGHPYRPGWRWGDIDPRRLFKDSISGSKLAKDSEEFRLLAREAVTLPFAARSVTQRVVVGWAHRDGVLPVDGWQREPDIMHEARSNPGKISSAVRRRNTVNPEKRIMYTEWDLVDLDCLLLMRMSRPPNVARQLRQTVKVGTDWHHQVWKALQYGWGKRRNPPRWHTSDEDEDVLADFPPVHEYENGPRPYNGDGTDEDVFLHLRRCGFGLTRLVGTKDCHALEETEMGAYITRVHTYDSRRKGLMNELAAKYACDAQDLDESVKSAYMAANMTFERIPEGRAIVRTCTKLARAHKYYFGQDGVLRYMVKNAVTGLEAMYSPEEIVRMKEQEESARKREADRERWALYK
ncbi:hypothetical protein AURDEDRAFT_176974 [Auricularia subglabra TFB-10046 SS5]|uniref:Uncharacterized protein n=1 Tax=Auricularia subglabra (strain TFB-10046 / SS5) TaxID=717982 RepID=J0LBY9_AURST|nr:hypothetical protein AURDEDRAFT_176974 [Auricularia subglabra TFB-10046 SS5]